MTMLLFALRTLREQHVNALVEDPSLALDGRTCTPLVGDEWLRVRIEAGSASLLLQCKCVLDKVISSIVEDASSFFCTQVWLLPSPFSQVGQAHNTVFQRLVL